MFLLYLNLHTYISRYIAAVLLGHVEPDFPYISDAATHSPESCVFGQLMNGGTVLCEFTWLIFSCTWNANDCSYMAFQYFFPSALYPIPCPPLSVS